MARTTSKRLAVRTGGADILRFIRAHNKVMQTHVDTVVVPYVQGLLDAAQKKTRHPLSVQTGMGCLYVERSEEEWSQVTTVAGNIFHHENAEFPGDWRYIHRREDKPYAAFLKRHMPEVVEALRVLLHVDEHTKASFGDIHPTVNPPAEATAVDVAYKKLLVRLDSYHGTGPA